MGRSNGPQLIDKVRVFIRRLMSNCLLLIGIDLSKHSFHVHCHSNGWPAIDPIILVKMLRLGYLLGIPSERCLVLEIW
ncbi:transposase [Photorhabdus heterorhabditis]|nr:transposase [Photorhabdus heterorhabditis]